VLKLEDAADTTDVKFDFSFSNCNQFVTAFSKFTTTYSDDFRLITDSNVTIMMVRLSHSVNAPYLPLTRKRSPDYATTWLAIAAIWLQLATHLSTPLILLILMLLCWFCFVIIFTLYGVYNRGVLKQQAASPGWGPHVADVLRAGIQRPKKGHDAGDHPPITPMKAASEAELGHEAWHLYDYITRHFIASVSNICLPLLCMFSVCCT